MRARLALALSIVCGFAAIAHARPVDFGPSDVLAVFVIRKTENRNRVEYGIHLDPRCAPEGPAPVVPYWRMLERGASFLQPLSRIELRAYGIASQEVQPEPIGGRVNLRLRPLPDLPIVVTSELSEGVCAAMATTEIAGRRARIRDILVVQSARLQVDHVELVGVAIDDGAGVRQTLTR